MQDGIETAQRVPKHQRAFRKADEFFVVPTQACVELIGDKRGNGLVVADDVEDLKLLQASREVEKAVFVQWGVVAQIASQAHDPALTLLRKNGAKAPIRRTGSDDGAKLSSQLVWQPAILSGGVANVDPDQFLARPLIAPRIQPCRS